MFSKNAVSSKTTVFECFRTYGSDSAQESGDSWHAQKSLIFDIGRHFDIIEFLIQSLILMACQELLLLIGQ